jgi:RNA polymerase sigma factor (sigma-70 family)
VSPYDLAAEIQEAYETSSKLLAVGYLGLIRDKIKKIKLSRHIYWEVTKEQSLDPKIVEAIEEFNSLRDRCITDNLSLVVNFATMYKKFTPISLLDLVQEGNLGLMRALDKYDPEKASQFSTYAVYWIKQFILRYIKKNKRVVRLPSHHQDQVAKMDQENISVEEIAEKLQVSLQVASDIRRTIRTPFSLTNETYSTNIPDESVPLDDHVHEITKTKKLRQRLRKLLSFVEWQVITAEMEGTTIKVDNKQELLKSARAKLAKDEALIRELREITR